MIPDSHHFGKHSTVRKSLFLLVVLLSLSAKGQKISVMKFPELQKKMLTADAPLTIFNFWATWCGPCVREIPLFEEYSSSERVKVYLVSLDFEGDLDKVKAFVKKKNLKSEVIFLNESDYDSYMAKVNKEWSGAIPATLFVDEWGKTYFHANEFVKEELDKEIKKHIN